MFFLFNITIPDLTFTAAFNTANLSLTMCLFQLSSTNLRDLHGLFAAK